MKPSDACCQGSIPAGFAEELDQATPRSLRSLGLETLHTRTASTNQKAEQAEPQSTAEGFPEEPLVERSPPPKRSRSGSTQENPPALLTRRATSAASPPSSAPVPRGPRRCRCRCRWGTLRCGGGVDGVAGAPPAGRPRSSGAGCSWTATGGPARTRA